MSTVRVGRTGASHGKRRARTRAHATRPTSAHPGGTALAAWPHALASAPPPTAAEAASRTCQTARNRSMPTCKRTALPEPSAAGYFASELARAPGPASKPSTTAKSAIGRCSSRCPTGSCTSCSSRMSTRSTMLCTRIGSLPTVPTSVRYPSTMGKMVRSSFPASIDAQPSTSRSVVRARH